MEIISRITGAFDVLARGWDGAVDSRFRTHKAFNQSPEGTEDSVTGPLDRRRLQLESRYMYRNNLVVRGLVDRLASYVVGYGLWPQARTSDPEWNRKAEGWWKTSYAPTCDARQHQGVWIPTFQKMIIRERMVAGEMGSVLKKNGQIQPIEASRIDTPSDYKKDDNVTEGIRRTDGGVVVGYYVLNRKTNGQPDPTDYTYVRRENFIHNWNPTRPDMIRGIPELAPAINQLRDLKETDEDIRAKIKADARTWAKSKSDSGMKNYRNRDGYKIEESTDTNPQRVEKVESLRLLHMKPHEDVDPFQSKTPSSEHLKYCEMSLRWVSQAFGLPYEFMMMILTSGSYSANRGALLAAHHTILDWVDWLNVGFNKRHWNWRVAKAMKRGQLPFAPTDENGQSEWYKVEWSLPPWQEIDSDKQAKGDAAKWKMGRDSLKSMIASSGGDRDDVLREKADDIQAAMDQAERLGGDVTWRDLIDVSTGQSLNAKPGAGNDESEDE